MIMLACASLAGCGDAQAGGEGAEAAAASGGSEITVELPPPAEPAKVTATGPAGQTDSFRLRAPEPGATMAAWAPVIRKAGFACDRILWARQLEREPRRSLGIYKIQCASGETYQGTRRSGRLYFRRWNGRLYGR
jgi:hypothetical protein